MSSENEGAIDLAFLESLEDSFKQGAESAAKGGGFVNKPDGTYETLLSRAFIKNNKDGKPMIQWEYVIQDGEHTGEKLYDFDQLLRENAFKWLGLKLIQYGIDPQGIKAVDLPGILAKLEEMNPTVFLKLKTKGEYQNTYIDKVVESGSSSGNEGELELRIGLKIRYKVGSDFGAGSITAIGDEHVTVMNLDDEEVTVAFSDILGKAK